MNAREAAAKAEPVEELTDSGDGKRERSSIEFPYLGLDSAVEVAKGINEIGGTSCGWEQLAAHLNMNATSGGYRMKLMTARTFGLVSYAQGIVSLTDLGRRLCDPQQEKAALADAFLKVPLYNAVYEAFKAGTLPPPDALDNEIAKLGVAPKQKSKARQVMQRSATTAGYFWAGSNRLVKPKASSAAAASLPDTEPEHTEKKKEKEEPEHRRRHPLIEGLLKELPEPQSEWTTEDRKKWLEMASTIFNVIYKDSDDSRGSLRVVVEKNSASK